MGTQLGTQLGTPLTHPVPTQRLLEERDALREANEELRCVQVQQSYLSQAGERGGATKPPREVTDAIRR